MSYKQAYLNALVLMSRGEIYYIPCLNKGLVLINQDHALELNTSILMNAQLRGHVEMVGRDALAERYGFTEAGERAALKAAEARAWE